MAQSKVFMTINYAVMVEVQMTLTGYRFKLQYDSRAFTAEQADQALVLFDGILEKMSKVEGKVGDLIRISSELDGLWKA